MNIVIVIKSKIPVFLYGGTQRVMWSLGKELARLGHKVTFIAGKGSTCDFARIVEYQPDVDIATLIPSDTDIVHFNDTVPEGFNAKPYVVTLHGNRPSGTLDKNTIFVSRNHAERFGGTCYVYNGLDWDEYGDIDLSAKRHDYHFLGKAAWSVKNVRGAIDIIKQIPGEKLNVLGGTRLNLKMGFRLTLTPKARFKGMVGGTEKVDYLKSSKGLIFPVLWDEPFGLAITESLYCGAPVFGTTHGSLPELVIPEVGFLSNVEAELVESIKANDFSPKLCHEYAREMFSANAMAEKCNGGGYLGMYERVLRGESLNPQTPRPIKPFDRYKML
ncbi:MAG: glycosyltransferase [Duncaniella sp.]|nr:glycosyltransferase [Duncaniella sp.]